MNNTGWTPLHMAAAEGHTQICSDLIKHNADLNNTDIKGNTCIHFYNRFETIEI